MIDQLALTQQLLDRLHAGGAYRFLWTPNGGQNGAKKRSIWFPVGQNITSPAAWSDKNVYFGVNPSAVQREYFEASTNDTIAAINCLLAEFDGADFTNPTEAEREAALAQIMAETPNKSVLVAMREAHTRAKKAKFLTDIAGYNAKALAHINSLDPAPSVVWFTGGGYQAVWLLTQTFVIHTEADRAMARHVQAAWVEYVGGDPAAKDLRRVFRLPGTTNRKKHFAPNYPTVHFIKFDLDLTYHLTDLAALLPTPAAAQQPAKATTQPTEQPRPEGTRAPFSGESVIAAYNAAHRYRDLALGYGYTDASAGARGARLSRPGQAESGGVELDLDGNRARHWSSNDEMHDPHWRRPFDLFCHFEHAGNIKAAVKAAAEALGMAYSGEKPPATVIDTTTGEIIPLADLMEFCRTEIARRMPSMKDSQVNVALGIVNAMSAAGAIELPLSDRLLSGLGAVSHTTANIAMKGTVIFNKETLPDGTVKRTPAGRQNDGLDQWLMTLVTKGNGILADVWQLSAGMMQAYRENVATRIDQQAVTSSLWQHSRGMLRVIEDHMIDDAFIRNQVRKKVHRRPKLMSPAEQTAHLEKMANAQEEDRDAQRLVDLMAHGQTEATIKRLDALGQLMQSDVIDNSKQLKSRTTVGLHIIASLTYSNGQDLTELAKNLNKHPAVISAAVKRLACKRLQEQVLKPLVRVVQFGASKRVFLYPRWQERLAMLRPYLHTDGVLVARQIGYANQRIRRIDMILPMVRKPELIKLYQEIRERTARMIAAIDGKPAKDAAQLLLLELAAEKRTAEQADFNQWVAERQRAQSEQEPRIRVYLGHISDNQFGVRELAA